MAVVVSPLPQENIKNVKELSNVFFVNSASLPSHNRYPADADCLINKINEIRRSGRDNNSQFR